MVKSFTGHPSKTGCRQFSRIQYFFLMYIKESKKVFFFVKISTFLSNRNYFDLEKWANFVHLIGKTADKRKHRRNFNLEKPSLPKNSLIRNFNQQRIYFQMKKNFFTKNSHFLIFLKYCFEILNRKK